MPLLDGRRRSDRKRISLVFRFDLDKTYLHTRFESLRGLARIPFEKPEDKRAIPGVTPLVRGLRQAARSRGRESRLYFLTGSPPQIGDAIRGKLALDGIEYDDIFFKDQLRNLMRGRFRNLREQVGFKLTKLLEVRAQVPEDTVEILFGDDWESDPLIYSLYADVCSGWLEGERLRVTLGRIGVDPQLIDEAVVAAAALPDRDAVRRIFILLARRTPPAAFHFLGPRVVPAFNYLQTGACLFEMGLIEMDSLIAIASELREVAGFSPAATLNSLTDIQRRGHLRAETRYRLHALLARRGFCPKPDRSASLLLFDRMRVWRRRRHLGEVLSPPADYEALQPDRP